MVLLTALSASSAVFASFGIDKAAKGYFALLLLLDTGMMGVFVSLDFFLFYIFWEVMLLPMYFLIGIWGGPRREYAAIKFFLYTLLGSVLMLLAMLGLYFYSAHADLRHDRARGQRAATTRSASSASRGSRCSSASRSRFRRSRSTPGCPTRTSRRRRRSRVILAGVLLKMGTYGILRINFAILPAASHELAWLFLGVLGTINIVYGAMCAMAQNDFKKLVAYSSISHMGYVMLGMAAFTAAGINGAVLQMFNHGTITAMLFLLVGVIYDRAHHREINGFGGLAQQMPVYAAITAFAFFARSASRPVGVHLGSAGAARRLADSSDDDRRSARRPRSSPRAICSGPSSASTSAPLNEKYKTLARSWISRDASRWCRSA